MGLTKAQIQVLEILKAETEVEIDQLYKRVEGLKSSDLDQLSDLMLINTTGYWQDNDAKGFAPLFIHITNSGRNAEINTDAQRIAALEAENAALKRQLEQAQQQSNDLAAKLMDADDTEDALKAERDALLALLSEAKQVIALRDDVIGYGNTSLDDEQELHVWDKDGNCDPDAGFISIFSSSKRLKVRHLRAIAKFANKLNTKHPSGGSDD